jgi:isoleucyl-tRNA synthetase
MGRAYWQEVMAVRSAVNREMESRRADGQLRGSLDAEVVLYCEPQLQQKLEALGDELRFVLISSGEDAAETEVPGLKLQVSVSAEEKCERCWHRRPEVGSVEAHPTLCGRCVENVDGSGEQRHFA